MTEKTERVRTSKARETASNHTNSERKPSRIPKNSLLFEKIIPAALVFLGVIMLGLIGIAIAVLAGLVSY